MYTEAFIKTEGYWNSFIGANGNTRVALRRRIAASQYPCSPGSAEYYLTYVLQNIPRQIFTHRQFLQSAIHIRRVDQHTLIPAFTGAKRYFFE